MKKVEHNVYDCIVYDSNTIERPFTVVLDNDPDVKMFFKIPDRFKIETSIGTYNPDWAVPVNAKSKKSTNSVELFVLFKRPQDAQPHNLLCDQRGLGALSPTSNFPVFAQAKNWEMGIMGTTMHCLPLLFRTYFEG